jgi:ribosome-binding ATPase YchF (GTP1/OBG family)
MTEPTEEELLRQLMEEAEEVREVIDTEQEEESTDTEAENEEDIYFDDQDEEEHEEPLEESPSSTTFEYDGRTFHLEPVVSHENVLNLDTTFKKTTEFIEVTPVKDGKIEAYNTKGEIVRLTPLEIERNYYKTADGTYCNVVNLIMVGTKYYNKFTTPTAVKDKFGNGYFSDDPTTFGFIAKINENGEIIKKDEEPVSSHVIANSGYVFINSLEVWINKSHLDDYDLEVKEGEIRKKRTGEEFAEDLYTQFPFFKQIADSIYQENWEIQYNQRHRKYGFVVKFEDFIISNSRGLTHNIKELYVMLPFKITGDKITLYKEIYGGRGLMSNDEYRASYSHSHLPSGFNSFSSFCLGTGPINGMIMDFNRDPSEQNLFSVLYNLKIYVEWESIEGTPHNHMSNVGKTEDSVSANQTISYNYNEIMGKYCKENQLPLSIHMVGTQWEFKLDEAVIESQLAPYFTNPMYLLLRDKVTGRYYRVNNQVDKERTSSDVLLTFKGEKIYAKTYNIVKENKNNDREYVIHPSITKQFITTTLRGISNYYFEKTTGYVAGKSNPIYI